jgi:regulator-associated protein of mTOR
MYLILAIAASFMLIRFALFVIKQLSMTFFLLFQSASQVCSGHFAAGFADGSVRLYDVRSPDRLVQ